MTPLAPAQRIRRWHTYLVVWTVHRFLGLGLGAVIVVVSLDAHHPQSGWIDIPVGELGVESDRAYQMHDLLTGARYLWSGPRNFVRLDPHGAPAHIFRLRRRIRSERDFDYFL